MRALSLITLALLSVPVMAETELMLGTGTGYGAHNYQLGVALTHPWHSLGSGLVSYGVAAELAYWQQHADDLVQLSLVPVLRYDIKPDADWRPFVYAGLGPAWISASQLGERDLAGEFQFSSRAGIGLAWGVHSLALDARHLSNGGSKAPNDGISYWNLSYHWAF